MFFADELAQHLYSFLQRYLCRSFITGDIVVLIWGMWLCYKIRNAPAAYNESKFISWAIYNAMFVTSFLMVVRLALQCPLLHLDRRWRIFDLYLSFAMVVV